MSIPAVKDFSNFNKYKTESGYTTQAQLQQFIQNQNDCTKAVVQSFLWQPETAYTAGAVIRSPSMATGVCAVVSVAGTTAPDEPSWTAASTEVTDGTVTYKMQSVVTQDIMTAAIAAAVQSVTATVLTQAKLDAHPVGSYYFSDDSTSPATLFGGTWAALDPGRVLLSQGTYTDSNGSVTYTAGTTGGERLHQLTVGELAKFTPTFVHGPDGLNMEGDFAEVPSLTSGGGSWHNCCRSAFNSVGNDKPHNNIQPYMAVYVWKRVQ
jgi:hypothetical protein